MRLRPHAHGPRVLPFAAALLLAGCGGAGADGAADGVPDTSEHGSFTLTVTTPASGFQRGANDFAVQAWDGAHRPVALTGVSARMPAHNHVSDPPQIVAQGATWEVHGLGLTMPGRWEITLLLAGGGQSDDAIITTTVR